MSRMRAALGIIAVTALVASVGPWSGTSTAQSAAEPQRGGALRIAMIGEPPSLDAHMTTSITAAEIFQNLYEGLFATDSTWQARPMLVDTYDVGTDRLTYTFKLRRGVKFHNGQDLTSADVKASLERWGRVAGRGRAVLANVASLTTPDPHTVVIRLKSPNTLLVSELGFSQQLAAVYPRDVVEEAGTGPIKRFIGTGPYRFVEHLPDRHIRLDRFDGYAARQEQPDGETGRKHAYLDSLFFLPVPDVAVRIGGVQRGEFHFARWIPQDDFARVQAMPNVVEHIIGTPWSLAVLFNNRAGIMTDRRVRQAFQAAVDAETVLRGTFGPPDFWRLNPGLMPKEHAMWSDSGKELYNQNNSARARQLLREAGYAGQPLRWITTMELPAYGISAEAAKPMLEQAGFVVDLQFMDWAGGMARRGRVGEWDVFSTALPPQIDPALIPFLLPEGPGWFNNDEINALRAQLQREGDPKVRRDLMTRFQRIYYEEAAFVKYGDYFGLNVHRPEVKGYSSTPSEIWWNVWLEPRR
jgi:peptide/nickel transport system substrate-binding protein